MSGNRASWFTGWILAGVFLGMGAQLSAADKNDKGRDAGLCGYWRMEEGRGDSLADSSRFLQGGKIQGTAAWIAGKRGKALAFNGTNDCVILGNPKQLQISGVVTLSAWVRPRATDGFRNIVAHGYVMSDAEKSEVVLRIEEGKYTVSCWDGETHGAMMEIPQKDLGQWVHVAGVYDGRTWKIYRNGELGQATDDRIGPMTVSADWAIGARGNGQERFFSGDIDEVRIYDRALADKEVAELAALRDEVQAGATKRPPTTTTITPSKPLVVDPPATVGKTPPTKLPNPTTASDFLLRGIERQAANDPTGAADDFTRVMELDPKLVPKALVRRARAHWAQADVHSALRDCEEALAQQPGYAYAWLVRAQIKAEAGDANGAAKDLEQAAEKLVPGAEPGSYNLRAGILASLARPADALSAYRLAARQEQIPAEIDQAQWGVWLTRSRQGEPLEACDELKKYLDTRKEQDWFKTYAGFAAGEIDEAKLFEDARQRAAGNRAAVDVLVQAHLCAGLKRLFAGDRTGARDQFQAGAMLGLKHGRSVDELNAELARLKKAN